VAIRSNRSIASVDSIVAEHLTGVGQSVAFVNALHHKNAAQRPIACQCFLQGLTVAPSPRLQPSHPMLRFMHGSGMWLVLTKARGPARVPLSQFHSMVWYLCLRENILSCGGDSDKDRALRTHSRRWFMAPESPPRRNVTYIGEEGSR
jgi:hypothetical protein